MTRAASNTEDVPQWTHDDEVIVLLTLEFQAGSAERVLDVLRPNIVLTRAEEGNNEFTLFAVDGTDATFVIFERWRSQADLDAHWTMPYMSDVFDAFDRYLVRPLDDAEDVRHLTDVMI